MYIVTHTDLDGVSCGILLSHHYSSKIEDVFYCNYGEVNEVLMNLPSNSDIYITDISCNKDTLEALLDKGSTVTIIDHHKTAEWLLDMEHPNLTVVLDTSMSATKLVYVYIRGNLYHPDYHGYVDAVNSHDLWLEDRGVFGDALSQLLGILGRERFIDRFKNNPSLVFSSTEMLLLEINYEKVTNACDTAAARQVIRKDANGNTYSIIYTPKFTSEVGNYICSNYDVDYVCLIHMDIRPNPEAKLGVVSLRSASKVDVSSIAQAHKGGGHPNAAGFNLENWDPTFFGIDLRVNI